MDQVSLQAVECLELRDGNMNPLGYPDQNIALLDLVNRG